MTDLKDLWLKILQDIYPSYDRANFITFFKNTCLLSSEENTLIVGVPRPMYLNWHLEHSRDKIMQSIKKIDSNIDEVIINIDGTLDSSDSRAIDILSHFPSKSKKRKLPGRQEVRLIDGITSKILNPKYRLSNFIVGESSTMAYAVANAVVNKPGDKYNPFFLYGDTGLGKTHILQAVGNEIILNNPEALIVYTTSESFTNEVVESIGSRSMDKLRKKYRKVDVLIIDDIQFIAGKDRTMEEFFHTFNALIEAGKQVIVASDRPPKELQKMEDRLISRFESGMTADLKTPSYETRLAILHAKAENCYNLIPSEIFEFIALNVSASVRELEGVLMQVMAIIELQGKSPDIKTIGDFIISINKDKQLVGFEPQKPILIKDMDDVIGITASYFNLTISDIKGPKRNREVMFPRQLAMFICRENLSQGLANIGSRFGGRDHTSVMHSIKKIEETAKSDPVTKKSLKELYKEMGIS